MNHDKLKIVFLHRANDPYTLERIKYFNSVNYEVYSISFSTDGYQSDLDGVNVIRLRRYKIDLIPFVKRISHYFEIKNILKKIKPDILHIVSALNLFYTFSKHSRVKIIENEGSDVIVSPQKYKFLITYYKFFYKKVNGVLQDSRVAFDKGIKYGAPADKRFNKIIEIGIDFSIFNKDVPKGIIREKYNLKDKKIIFHSRGINELYNIDIILKSIIKLRERYSSFVYILTTTMDDLKYDLRQYIINNRLEDNLLLVGRQDRVKSLKHFYRDADVNISVPSSDSSPFSVYESMACMTPNVVTDLPWLYDKFVPDKHLITCPVRDADLLADKILSLLNSKITLDLDSAYDVVFNQINFEKENNKLNDFYTNLLKK